MPKHYLGPGRLGCLQALDDEHQRLKALHVIWDKVTHLRNQSLGRRIAREEALVTLYTPNTNPPKSLLIQQEMRQANRQTT